MRAFQRGARLQVSSTTTRLSAWWEQHMNPFPFFLKHKKSFFSPPFHRCLNKRKCVLLWGCGLEMSNLKSFITRDGELRPIREFRMVQWCLNPHPLLGNSSSFWHSFRYLLPQFSTFWLIVCLCATSEQLFVFFFCFSALSSELQPDWSFSTCLSHIK